MTTIHHQLSLEIECGQPIQLSGVLAHRSELSIPGVYYLAECRPEVNHVSPFEGGVVYIGKAVRETIFSRCQKHMWTVQNALLGSGKPKTRPGVAFKSYRETIACDPSRLWLVPGKVAGEPFLVTCAEEYLLFEYRRIHGRLPLANTSG